MNQCDYASVQEGNLNKHLKLTKEKRLSYAKKKLSLVTHLMRFAFKVVICKGSPCKG